MAPRRFVSSETRRSAWSFFDTPETLLASVVAKGNGEVKYKRKMISLVVFKPLVEGKPLWAVFCWYGLYANECVAGTEILTHC
jgi:hypothetical protein